MKRGRAGPSRPPQVPVRPVYEDFRPFFERKQDKEDEKLLIHLPGFPKENIRVSTEGKNTVRIRGEHLVAGNKWNRFQEDFLAPEDCNMEGISARFENGILTITLPTKNLEEPQRIPTPSPPKETPHENTTLHKSPDQHDSPPMLSESQEKDDNYEDKANKKEITSSTGIYMQVVKSLTEPCEKRQLLMNAGAAVLVIVALGAYISLQYRDSA